VLNVDNGILNLRTKELRPHEPDALHRKITRAAWDPAAQAPRFQQFLEQVQPNREVRRYLQRLVGYALTGDVSEQIFVIHIGNGGNGKSVFVNIMQALFGSYAGVAAKDLIVVQRHDPHPTSKADLFGLRLAVAVEVGQRSRLDESHVKELTGGDRLQARRMRENFWHFDPTHKLWLVANHLPDLEGVDHGIWRRIKVVDWPVTISDRDRNLHLAEQIISHELPGVLRWAVEGGVAWQREGLTEPATVAQATATYRGGQDQVGAFLDDEGITVDPDDAALWIPAGDIWKRYDGWCQRNGYEPVSSTSFGKLLGSRGCKAARKRLNGRASPDRIWRRIGFRTA